MLSKEARDVLKAMMGSGQPSVPLHAVEAVAKIKDEIRAWIAEQEQADQSPDPNAQ